MLNGKRLFKIILSSLFLCLVLSSVYVFAQDNTTVTERISGNNRYETSTAISGTGWVHADTVIIVSGIDYPDALSASALSKSNDAPILLTDKSALQPTTLAELNRLKPLKALLIGGTGVISTNVENQLKTLKISITRIGGTDRYDTSKKVAEIVGVKSGVILAANLDFPDPLSIAPIAAMKGIPILLTPKNSLNPNIAAFINGKSIGASYLVGGTGVLDVALESSVPGIKRLSGADRYATNLSINTEFAADFKNFDTIYLASGNDFPDALSGSALAAKNNAPIFLTDKDSISNATVEFIKSNNVKHVVILGGTGSISKSVENTISVAVKSIPVKATSIILSKNTVALIVGASETLASTVVPANTTNKNVTWSSSDKEIAVVDNSGEVTAVSAGTAIITAASTDGGNTAACTVTVAIPLVINPTSVILNKNTDTITVGDSDTLSVSLSPENSINKAVTWVTSDNSIAGIDNTGKVTAISIGTAAITVTTEDGKNIATCIVTIVPVVKVTGINLTPTTDEISVGTFYNLTAAVSPENATNKAIIWTSLNNYTATVDSTGKVTGVKVGTAVITGTTADGSYAKSWNVTVSPAIPVNSIPVNTIPINTIPIKFAIDMGHNSKYDTGAVGIKSEDVLNKEVGTRVISLLTNLGYTAINCAPKDATSLTDSLKQRVDTANAANADYYVSIHFNSFSGDASGTMIYSSSTAINSKANKILSNMQSAGYYNRGLLDNSRRLFVLTYTNMPAMLIECAFVTSAGDMSRYNPDTIAGAIVDGLINGN